MLFDDGAFRRVQGALGNAEIVDFLPGQEIARLSVRSDPPAGGDLSDPRLILGPHEFAAGVAAA